MFIKIGVQIENIIKNSFRTIIWKKSFKQRRKGLCTYVIDYALDLKFRIDAGIIWLNLLLEKQKLNTPLSCCNL